MMPVRMRSPAACAAAAAPAARKVLRLESIKPRTQHSKSWIIPTCGLPLPHGRGSVWCAMNDLETNVRPDRRIETYESVQFVFLKALAVIYFIAFLSFGMQVTGLIGEHGILPLG